MAWVILEASVDGYAPELFTAPTRDKARWRAYRAFAEGRRCTFAEFIARTSTRLLREPPTPDGYDNVRDQYGVDPRVGERRRLVNEGPNSGRVVVVIYPGRHTSMIHCHYEGDDRAMIVHPLNAVHIA